MRTLLTSLTSTVLAELLAEEMEAEGIDEFTVEDLQELSMIDPEDEADNELVSLQLVLRNVADRLGDLDNDEDDEDDDEDDDDEEDEDDG